MCVCLKYTILFIRLFTAKQSYFRSFPGSDIFVIFLPAPHRRNEDKSIFLQDSYIETKIKLDFYKILAKVDCYLFKDLER